MRFTIGRRGRLALHLALGILLVATGCGYKPLTGRDRFGPELRRIEIRTFQNQTTEPGLEQLIGDAVAEEFARRGWLRPQLEGDTAPDLVLDGALSDVIVRPNSYSSVALALEDQIEIVFEASVRVARSGEIVWRHPDFRIAELFVSSADPQTYRSNKEQALRRVSAEIAERIHDELFQDF